MVQRFFSSFATVRLMPSMEIKKSEMVRDIEAVDDLYTRVKRADESRPKFGL